MDVICTSQNTSTVTSLAWSPDSRRVGAGCYGGIAWHEPPTAQPVKRFDWKGSILTLAISPNGKWVASGNQDSSVHVWRLWSGKDLQMSGYDAKIEHIAWDPTSRWLCVGGVGEVTVWDFNGKGPQGSRPISLEGHNRHITGVAFNGNRLATSAADGTLFIWQLPADEPLATCDLGQEISRVAWHPSGQRLAIGTATGDIFIVNHPTA